MKKRKSHPSTSAKPSNIGPSTVRFGYDHVRNFDRVKVPSFDYRGVRTHRVQVGFAKLQVSCRFQTAWLLIGFARAIRRCSLPKVLADHCCAADIAQRVRFE